MVPIHCLTRAEDLINRVGLQPREHVLDVASGTGIISRYAARHVGKLGHVTEVELNPSMLEIAGEMSAYIEQIEFLEGNALDLPVPDARFDVIFCQQALMFFPDREPAVREMHRALKPGGNRIHAISVHNQKCRRDTLPFWTSWVQRYLGGPSHRHIALSIRRTPGSIRDLEHTGSRSPEEGNATDADPRDEHACGSLYRRSWSRVPGSGSRCGRSTIRSGSGRPSVSRNSRDTAFAKERPGLPRSSASARPSAMPFSISSSIGRSYFPLPRRQVSTGP
ncbi:MAG: class I SAM-dependent methyltransferase, partial [Acidobacteriota bacterium]